MIFIIALDPNNGVSFNCRRQSRDALGAAKVLEKLDERNLWVSPKAAKLFAGAPNLCPDEEYFAKSGDEDACFAEELPPVWEKITEIWVLRWDKVYPADVKMDLEGWKLTETEEFAGSSHETLTLEIYRR